VSQEPQVQRVILVILDPRVVTGPEVHREIKVSQDRMVVRDQVVPKVMRVYRVYLEKIQMCPAHRVSKV
jgi:hypothetical protein